MSVSSDLTVHDLNEAKANFSTFVLRWVSRMIYFFLLILRIACMKWGGMGVFLI